jgi:hypothetical protein
VNQQKTPHDAEFRFRQRAAVLCERWSKEIMQEATAGEGKVSTADDRRTMGDLTVEGEVLNQASIAIACRP